MTFTLLALCLILQLSKNLRLVCYECCSICHCICFLVFSVSTQEKPYYKAGFAPDDPAFIFTTKTIHKLAFVRFGFVSTLLVLLYGVQMLVQSVIHRFFYDPCRDFVEELCLSNMRSAILHLALYSIFVSSLIACSY